MPNENHPEDTHLTREITEMEPHDVLGPDADKVRKALEDQELAAKVDRLLGIDENGIGARIFSDIMGSLSDNKPLTPLKGNFHSPRGH